MDGSSEDPKKDAASINGSLWEVTPTGATTSEPLNLCATVVVESARCRFDDEHFQHFAMAKASWPEAVIQWSAILIIILFGTVLVLYTVVMSYCNARILSRYRVNRSRVFQEQAVVKAKSEVHSEESTSSTDPEAVRDTSKDPYIIAGFFHPYW